MEWRLKLSWLIIISYKISVIKFVILNELCVYLNAEFYNEPNLINSTTLF